MADMSTAVARFSLTQNKAPGDVKISWGYKLSVVKLYEAQKPPK